MEYQQEENAEEEVFVKQPILLDENFRAGSTSEIAELLTDSQKERLSNALLDSINNHLLKLNDAENAEEITPDYDFINLIGHWDKTYLSMSSFALLQNTADSNHRRVSYLLRVITYFLKDNELYEISAEYEDVLSQDENAVIEFSDEKVFTSETALEVENFTENRVVVKVPEETVEENEKGNSDESIKKPANETTYKQYREKLRLKFNRQYGIVISQTSASR